MMGSVLSRRWLSYPETRCSEILRATELGDLKTLLFVLDHHLRVARDEMQNVHPEETLSETARRVLDHRLIAAQLGLTILALGGFDKAFDALRDDTYTAASEK